ncbi:hypothetical protein [Roseateles sp.]|uniref:hypothetical protein n=1 Tax=Roseateles sp. TaxID=1971397 RepID=UPI0032653824
MFSTPCPCPATLSLRRVALLAATAATLAGCGGGGSAAVTPPLTPPAAPAPAASAPAPAIAMVTLTGVAARGAPIVGGSVTAACISGPATVALPTSATGTWTVDVPANTLPCALQVSGGTAGGVANPLTLHSLAVAAGRVNITPLTDLTIARAAGKSPATWFAGLAAAPTGTRLDTAAALTQLLATLVAGSYTLPAGTFDPFTVAFEAKAGDTTDALLDSLMAGLLASHKTYIDLIADFSVATAGIYHLPPALTGNPPAPTGPNAIVLTPKGQAAAADVAPAVGTWQGQLGRVFTPGQATQETTTCSIAVAADGMLTVSAGGRTLQAAVNGDVGDLILNVVGLTRVQASDVPNDRYAQLTLVKGVMAQGVARQGGFGFTTAEDRVECWLSNPNPTVAAGNANVATLNGATAADMSAALVGHYTGANCTLDVSSDGVFHLVAGALDVTTRLGGDENDVIVTFGDSAAVQAQDYFTAGEQIYVTLSYQAGNVALNVPASFSADAQHREPRPVKSLAQCSSLVKQ